MRKGNDKKLREIGRKIAEIKEPVAKACKEKYGRKELEWLQNVEYMPTSFDVADFYNIKYEFVPIRGEMPSYLNNNIIYISDKYQKDSYKAKILCAHELGHYFLHNSSKCTKEYAMNNDILNIYLPQEMQEEYEANVFSILLMPQIMPGEAWENYSPKRLNREVYEKIM